MAMSIALQLPLSRVRERVARSAGRGFFTRIETLSPGPSPARGRGATDTQP